MTKADKRFNRNMSCERILNGHVIGVLKRFRIISGRYWNRRIRFYPFSIGAIASPAALVNDFSDRWAVEDVFRNVKQYLGAEQPQSWKDLAPERAGAFSCLVYGAVWLARVEREGKKTAVIQSEWHREKDCVSFLDALADMRQSLWREKIKDMSTKRHDQRVIHKLVINAPIWAA